MSDEKEFLTLAVDKVAVGSCVIMNHCDQPWGGCVAVVVGITSERITARYLAKGVFPKECWTRNHKLVTPVGHFGIEVRLVGSVFRCQPVGSSRAMYKDGCIRPWQEYSGFRLWPIRPSVLRRANLASSQHSNTEPNS